MMEESRNSSSDTSGIFITCRYMWSHGQSQTTSNISLPVDGAVWMHGDWSW